MENLDTPDDLSQVQAQARQWRTAALWLALAVAVGLFAVAVVTLLYAGPSLEEELDAAFSRFTDDLPDEPPTSDAPAGAEEVAP